MKNDEKQHILRLIRKHGSVSAACSEMDISRTRFYRECDKDPVFRAKTYRARTDWALKRV
jgi:transcriptional regulator with PAS, ATPase and Fis domain